VLVGVRGWEEVGSREWECERRNGERKKGRWEEEGRTRKKELEGMERREEKEMKGAKKMKDGGILSVKEGRE
jgi:hypothetical protein